MGKAKRVRLSSNTIPLSKPHMNMAFQELEAAIERDNQNRRERRAIEKLRKRPIGKRGIQ
jgi:hypothetical protein